jgi:hypothetical protein
MVYMEKHLKEVLSEDDILNFRNQANQIKETSSVRRWDEFAKEPEPEFTDTHKIIHNLSLGKITLELEVPEHVKEKIVSIANEQGFDVRFIRAAYTEYAPEYGRPHLVEHQDKTDIFMIDYQISGNTSWPMVVNGNTYELKDNEAIAFCPARLTHSRPEKKFESGTHIAMIFFDTEILGNLTDISKE